ncbi:hypothetical protein CXB51_020509 [Gossypium anomalum]|uniref:RNase H type-1 domain-containing protein n=1 Tax=Gossypium anomalum TaxID=47600 RepID=A0A8J6CYJ6_9ROSI|nr:hypothetical protein CXB51_020509 [Gossypium anomalum]
MATREGVLKGVKASRSGPRVSHLLFADDCILFKEATRRGVCAIKQILREYKNSSVGLVTFIYLEEHLGTMGLIHNELCWRVGRGTEIDVWTDCWIPGSEAIGRPDREVNSEVILVSDLTNSTNRTWKRDLINNTFQPDIAQKILQIPLAEIERADFQVWKEEPSGEFSLTWVFERSTKKQCRSFCCALWYIWSSRNQFVHEKKIISVRDIAQKVSSYIAELDGIRKKKLTFTTERVNSQTEATEGTTVQFDVAFDRRNARPASGIVFRDQTGDLKALKSVLHENIPSPFTAEALAGLDAIKLVIEVGLRTTIIKGDSKTVIKKCQSTEMDKSVLRAIIHDIQIRKSSVQDVTFQFIHRSKNTQAHNLAKEALERRDESYLVGEITAHRVANPEGRWRENPD